jgi:hypothetical protein
MSKRLKKRNKPYTGADAANSKPRVKKYSIPDRSATSQWWHENQRTALLRGALGTLAVLVGWLVYSLIH